MTVVYISIYFNLNFVIGLWILSLSKSGRMMENNFPDDAYLHDPSTRKLDKWRSLFHMFNMTTLTVAFISLGVSLLTFYAAPGDENLIFRSFSVSMFLILHFYWMKSINI